MDTGKKDLVIQLLSLVVMVLVMVSTVVTAYKPKPITTAIGTIDIPTTTPTPFNPYPYKITSVPKAHAYQLMLVGDSMIDAFGPNANPLRLELIKLYPEHEFVNYNYGFGATSIETLPERLVNETEYNGGKYQAILSQGFDLIIIESFAYNPLSQHEKGEGLAKHLEILDQSVRKIISEKPDVPIILMTPIAPSKQMFAKGIYDLPPVEREQWAMERISYIEGVINFANEKGIPLINIYEKSLNSAGDANLSFINPDDYIHPSKEGIDLMAEEIAKFVFENEILPK